MAVTSTPFGEIAKSLDPDAEVDLYELDYSKLLGAAIGTNVLRYTPNADPLGTTEANSKLSYDGAIYEPLPIELRGAEEKTDGSTAKRARVRLANHGGLLSSLIDALVGDLTGALVTRKRVFRRHLDDGDDPDPYAYRIQKWIIEQKRAETFWQIDFELAPKGDADDLRLPLRGIEFDVCTWAYLSAGNCGWVPGAGPYFDAEDNSVGTVGEDDCGLRQNSCKIRFGARSEASRFGGFPGAQRTIR